MKITICLILVCVLGALSSSYSRGGVSCFTKKKIVLDVGKSGLGNRLVAIASAAILAMMTSRVLQLVWNKDKSCEELYDNLFDVQNPSVHGFQPFEVEEYPGETIIKDASFCRIHLDGVHDQVLHGKVDVGLHHFHFVNDTVLFNRLDAQCDVIYIHGNIYYGHLLLGPSFGKYSAYIRKHLKAPFHDLSKVVFRPKSYLMRKVDKIVEALRIRMTYNTTREQKWLSIHMRGIMTKAPEKTFACANALLSQGLISGVFFATDSAPLEKLAYSSITDSARNVLTVEKHLERKMNMDSWDIRNNTVDMRTAVVEWYTIGEADYCMSPSLATSTFTKTAIARGDCLLIDASYGDKCFIPSPKSSDLDKEWVLHMKQGNRHRRYEWMYLPHIGRETVWSTVEKGEKKIVSHCLNKKFLPKDIIYNYWFSGAT